VEVVVVVIVVPGTVTVVLFVLVVGAVDVELIVGSVLVTGGFVTVVGLLLVAGETVFVPLFAGTVPLVKLLFTFVVSWEYKL